MKVASTTLLVAWLSAVSCRQVIGIEEAQEDRTLTSTTSGGMDPASSAAGAAGERGGREAGGGAATGDAGERAAGASNGPGAAGAGGADPSASLCERYCSTVMTGCSGAFAVYTTLETCLALCQFMPEGSASDRSGNSVWCRLHAAESAPDEVPHYCSIAGPGGNGVCGTNCESLCQLREGVCSAYVEGDTESCLEQCAKLEDRDIFSTDLSVGQYSGAHVQCRLYHLSAAASDDAERHCQHVDGAAPCR